MKFRLTKNPASAVFLCAVQLGADIPQWRFAVKVHELYDTVTNRIIKELEAGAAPWVKPWKNGPATGILPHNGATNRPYNSINVMLLWAEREVKGYSTSNWMTYRQALAFGAQVKGGEKATTVVFTKQLRFRDRDGRGNEGWHVADVCGLQRGPNRWLACPNTIT
jgi:antirestriction protein ArdC